MNLYNEIDPYCCDWLENLIHEKLIPDGVVDRRSIVDIVPNDLRSFTQCHFFAGLGGWPLALRRAGYPDHRAVWTGSCPCQPFSRAGKRLGFADDRHLWPYWRYLIQVLGPAVVFGEQVASAADWLGLVRGGLEALEYAVGCMPIEAASAGADHGRDRYWFVANADGEHQGDQRLQRGGQQRWPGSAPQDRAWPIQHAAQLGWGEGWTEHEVRRRGVTAAVASIGNSQIIECPDGKWRRLPPPRVRWLGVGIPARVAKLRAFGNAIDPRPAAAFIKAAMQAIDSPPHL